MLATLAGVTICATASLVRPVFLADTRMAVNAVHQASIDSAALANAWLDSAFARAPWLLASHEEAVLSEQFTRDRDAFAADLLRTGRLSPARARTIADVAVREAYRQRVPPALVLGIMLTENDDFKPAARSKVGAIGLMQVYGKLWRGSLGRKYGTDLRDDATNLRYGIHILRYMTRQVPDSLGPEDGWRKALLGYNGCVRGTNTPNCHRYPDVVRRNVMRRAVHSCGGDDFARCVIGPLWLAVRDDRQQQRRTD
jgi:soluble lytic murein transglycosylase-like protein